MFCATRNAPSPYQPRTSFVPSSYRLRSSLPAMERRGLVGNTDKEPWCGFSLRGVTPSGCQCIFVRPFGRKQEIPRFLAFFSPGAGRLFPLIILYNGVYLFSPSFPFLKVLIRNPLYSSRGTKNFHFPVKKVLYMFCRYVRTHYFCTRFRR